VSVPVGSSNSGQANGNRPGDPRARAGDPPRATVVVLDDDLVFRRGVARVLRSEGFDVIEVEDGEELEAALTDTPVDLIVADSRLADGTDGWLEANAIADRHGRVRVLAITGYDADAIAAVGGFTGVEFVQKEGAGFNIVRAVEEALGR
jgi:CheY-like chemotaxis protein